MISSFVTMDLPNAFSLERTIWLMRRLETNIVDNLTPDRRFVRLLDDADGNALLSVTQSAEQTLLVTAMPTVAANVIEAYLTRRLGLGCDLQPFVLRVRTIPWLAPVVPFLHGVRPPRYPTLWEACVNAIVFQQISLSAASAILRRVVLACTSVGVELDGLELRPFPGPQAVHDASLETLRAAGLSTAKIATLRRIAAAVLEERLREEALERLSSPAAAGMLCEYPGIGPWTAAVILLRGLGRLDVFPENDSGAAKSLRAIAPELDTRDITSARERLGEYQGMLYFSLLMARLCL